MRRRSGAYNRSGPSNSSLNNSGRIDMHCHLAHGKQIQPLLHYSRIFSRKANGQITQSELFQISGCNCRFQINVDSNHRTDVARQVLVALLFYFNF